jgi:hypothetical protein
MTVSLEMMTISLEMMMVSPEMMIEREITKRRLRTGLPNQRRDKS